MVIVVPTCRIRPLRSLVRKPVSFATILYVPGTSCDAT